MRRDRAFWGAQAASLQLPGASRQHVREAPARCAATREKVRRRRLRRPARWQRALPRTACHAFTLIELLVVMTIIIILAGLILSISSFVQNKGGRSRAEAEIAAMSAALESYKADNGIYPYSSDTTDLDARAAPAVTNYPAATIALYDALSGDVNRNRQIDAAETSRSYYAFKPASLLPAPPLTADVTSIRDPFGNSYGYSTAGNPIANPTPAAQPVGYNPTYDLWSIAEPTATPTSSPTPKPQNHWIKNW